MSLLFSHHYLQPTSSQSSILIFYHESMSPSFLSTVLMADAFVIDGRRSHCANSVNFQKKSICSLIYPRDVDVWLSCQFIAVQSNELDNPQFSAAPLRLEMVTPARQP
jgi:hypothetical protein